jgi:hypothetical protein
MSASKPSGVVFPLGRILATPGALEAIAESGEVPTDFLERHCQGDWGCVPAGDARLNEEAVRTGARILSAYDTRAGARIWVITEAEDDAGARAATTILLPSEY